MNEFFYIYNEEIQCYFGAYIWEFEEALGRYYSLLSKYYCRKEKIGKRLGSDNRRP